MKTANKFFYDSELDPSFPHSSPTRRLPTQTPVFAIWVHSELMALCGHDRKEYGDGDSAVNIESINYVLNAWRRPKMLLTLLCR